MMSAGILTELQAAAVAFLSGALITVVYDLLRIVRRAIPHGNVWIGIEDFIFWIWAALWIFSVLYRENDGNLRFYTMIAMAAGMILYHRTVSEPLVRLFGRILKKLVGLLGIPFRLLKKYLKFLGNKLKKNVKGIIMRTSK